MHDYEIRAEWNPFCNFRLPITKFCKLVLDQYPIHISQLHPLGLVKLRQFEFACIALGHIPELLVFRVFFILVWKSPFFTFDRRDTDVSCLRDIPTSSKDKDWKKKFFYIDAGVIPGEMHWREIGPKDKVKDEDPPKDAYVANALYTKLCGHPSECTVIPEGALVMAGMSMLWRDIKLYPSFRRDDEGKWSLFDFVDPPLNAALRVADSFLLPAVPANPAVYISQPPPSGGSNVVAIEKKSTQIKVTGRKYLAAGASTSLICVTAPVGSAAVLLLS
ncbi:hypothetical protein Hanom_Chr16g01426011 [Helianthus anomalus]